jgi:trans-aconitate 2-methyltransferase
MIASTSSAIPGILPHLLTSRYIVSTSRGRAMRWDPAQYGKFATERSQPFFDLVSRIGATRPRRVVDVGCGPGVLTAVLAERWPDAVVEGIDSSPEMIERASPLTSERLNFRVADAAMWTPPPDTDVLVSNATLQWVPNHPRLLERWAHALPRGAWLAFQVPGNFGAPSHALMRELAQSPEWREPLQGVLRHHDSVLEPERYARLLLDADLESVTAWETTYLHLLAGDDPVLEWVRGTGLRPVVAALSPDAAAEFERSYASALRRAYPRTPHGTLFPFRRVFAVAQVRD